MLDTLLQIGRTFREEKRLYHHRYIKPAPIPDEKNPIAFLSIPVSEDFQFDLNNITEIPENQRDKLYYLTYQTSDSDTSIRTLFGDIYCYLKGDSLKGNYRSKKFDAYSSFERGEAVACKIQSAALKEFRKSLSCCLDRIDDFISEKKHVFFHFDFNGKSWYDFDGGDTLEKILDLMVSEFASESKVGGKSLWVMNKMLYRSICSGDSQNDIQFPNFNTERKYRSVSFSLEQMKDLFYAINYSEKPLISEKDTKSDIKIIVMPKGEGITSKDLEDFSNKKIDEEVIANIGIDIFEDFFHPFLIGTSERIVEFDVLFCRAGGQVDIDVMEISSVKKSFLKDRLEQINNIKNEVYEELKKENIKENMKLPTLSLRESLYRILGPTKHGSQKYSNDKRYQNHLLKILPQIYTGTYYQDDVLLTAFIEKVEFDIRNNSRAIDFYNFLKYDYYFLTKIQNINFDRIMEMKNSLSYKAGLLLGKMAKPLNKKINSFQKNYVGLLSRRIADKQGLIDFANFINEKLAIHDVAYPDLQKAAVELSEIVSKMSDKEYLKHHCAFGFFESYFKYEPKEKSDAEQENQSSNN